MAAGSLAGMISWIEWRFLLPSLFRLCWSMNTDKALVDIIFIDKYYLFREFEFKIIATCVLFPIFQLRRNVSHANGNPSLQILEYSTPRSKFQTQIWISNSVGAKFTRWHLGINYFWRQLVSLLELYLWHLGLASFRQQPGSSLGLEIPGDSFLGISLFFCWHLIINSFWRQLGYLLELSRWHLVINYFWHQIKYSLGLGIPVDSFSGISLCFPLSGFTMFISPWETTHFPVDILLWFSFLGQINLFVFNSCQFLIR